MFLWNNDLRSACFGHYSDFKKFGNKLAASGAKLATCLGKGYHISYVSGKGTSLQNYFPKSKSMNGQ